VLAGAAGVGAASLLEPVAALAETVGARQTVFSSWVGSLAGDSGPLHAPRRFQLVGVEWTQPSAARLELRARASGGRWSSWVVASVVGHGPDRAAAGDQIFGEAIWTGDADYVQLRASRPVRGLRLHFVGARPSDAASVAQVLPLATPVLDAGPGQPPIIDRAVWAQGQAPPSVPASFGAVRLAFVHHTQSPNGYGPGDVPGMVLSIFDYHRYVRGFHDIAYNFMIDAFGRIWEGRAGGIDKPVRGAHAGGYNAESMGVAVIGSFIAVAPPPAAIAALERLLAWKLSLHGLPTLGQVTVEVSPASAFYTPFAPGAHVSLPRIAGHRDGDSTDCPGDAFYARLPSIRPRVAALTGTPARITLAPPQTAVVAGSPVLVSGRLTKLSGAPLPGEPVEVQQVSATGEKTIARATTATDGKWSADLAVSFNAQLRALHRPAPATVSDVVQLGVAPLITLAVDSLPPLRVGGIVRPGKRFVTIHVHALGGKHRRHAMSKRVAVERGRFSARLAIRRRGRYLVRARTSADAGNVAGASAVVEVTV
jgi:hypothetical protein